MSITYILIVQYPKDFVIIQDGQSSKRLKTQWIHTYINISGFDHDVLWLRYKSK